MSGRACPCLPGEALHQGFFEVVLQRLDFDSFEKVRRKSVRQHATGFSLRDTPGPQVEHGVLAELTDRRAVCAANVIRVDLELRLRIDFSLAREQQVLVVLDRVGLLRVLANDDLPVKHSAGIAVQYALVELVRVAVGCRVIDRRVMVNVLLTAHDEQSVKSALGPLALELDVDVVASQLSAERERDGRNVGVTLGQHLNHAGVIGVERLLLGLEMINPSTFFGDDVSDGIGPLGTVSEANVAFDDRS